MIISASDLFRPSDTAGAVAAFNVITLEHAEAVARAAEETGLPVIMQLSQNAIGFHGNATAIAASMRAVAEASPARIALHLDHITDVGLARTAVDLGFSSVMFDGAEHDFDENVALTRSVADWGEAHGVWVEAELGAIGGKDGAHAPGVRTDPAEAALFVERTGVDSLAVAVGSSHAMTDRSAALDTDLIASLAAAVDVPLVLHGSSGVPDEGLAAAVAAGMRKINIGTALNIAFTGRVREQLDASPSVDPRRYIGPARDDMAETCAHYLRVVAGRVPSAR